MKRNITLKPLLAALALASASLIASIGTAQTTGQFAFSPNRPRLVILLHGVTPKPAEDPVQQIGYNGHARYYWGYRFVKGLMGQLDQENMRVVTPYWAGLRIRTDVPTDWKSLYPYNSSSDLAPTFMKMSPIDVPLNMEQNDLFVKEYIKLTTKSGANSTMVMIPCRDGSKHLMPQVADTVRMIYKTYIKTFGHLPEAQQPQIYLVGHSFGGVIARAILANPYTPDLFGNYLTLGDHYYADFIRKRTVLVQTLAAPHEGTLIGDMAGDIAGFIRKYGYSAIYTFLDQYNFWASEKKTKEEIRATSKEMVKTALNNVSGERDCLQDLLRMNEYNTGILRQSTAVRYDGGPLVPIYTAAGRNPGGTYFDQSRSMFILGGNSYNPVTTLDMLANSRFSMQAGALYLIERLLHEDGFGREGKRPWGTATLADGDRVAGPFTGIGPATARPLSAAWVPTSNTIFGVIDALVSGSVYRFGLADGEWDNDGFLAFDSANALHFGGSNYFRLFDQGKYSPFLPWDNDNHGSIMWNAGVGTWIHNEVIRPAGPYIFYSGQRRSVWSTSDVPVTPASGVKVEILSLKDYHDDLDYGSKPDYTVRVRIGSTIFTTKMPEDTATPLLPLTYSLSNYRSQVVPIRIDIMDRDLPYSPDDICVLSPVPGQTSLYLYVDMRTGRITGDYEAAEGQIKDVLPLWVAPIWWETFNQVSSRIRITRTGVIP